MGAGALSRALAGCALCASVVLAAPAVRADAQAPGEVDFSLVPVGAEPYFVFDARAGQTIARRLDVVSRGDRTQRVVLRAVDVGTAATGGLSYGTGSARAVGAWLSLAQRSLILSPGEVAHVPFEAHIPRGARPGDHLAGIAAYEPARSAHGPPAGRPRGPRLVFRSRLAVAVQVRVPGARGPRLEFRGATIEESPSGVRIYLRLRNAGNTLIERTKGDVTVTQGGQDQFTTAVDPDAFAPDTEIRYPIPLPGPPVQGSYHIAGSLRPQGAAAVKLDADVELTGAQATRFERLTGKPVKRPFDASPFLTAGLVLALLSAAGFLVAYRRARRQLRERPPGG